MIFLKIIIDLACGALNALGGYHWLFCRRFILPALIGLSFIVFTHVWWALFLPLPAMATLSLGYFKTKNVNIGRGLWLGLQAFVLGLGITIVGHGSLWLYIPYIAAAFGLGCLYSGWQQIIGDSIAGVLLGSIVLWAHP